MPRFRLMVLAVGLASLAGAAEKLSIQFDTGRLTTRIENASIRAVLSEIAARTGLKITMAEAVEEFEVSVDMKATPLEIALRALLPDQDAFFYYGGSANEPPSLKAVWVYPKGGAAAFQPQAAGAGAMELETALSDPSAEVRQRAYEALMARPDGRSLEILIAVIRGDREKDDELRQRVLSAALTKGQILAPDTLADMARGDRSEHIRWMALDALAQHESVKQVAEAALGDSSEVVRQRAADILAELKAEAERTDGTPRPPEQQP